MKGHTGGCDERGGRENTLTHTHTSFVMGADCAAQEHGVSRAHGMAAWRSQSTAGQQGSMAVMASPEHGKAIRQHGNHSACRARRGKMARLRPAQFKPLWVIRRKGVSHSVKPADVRACSHEQLVSYPGQRLASSWSGPCS